MHTEPRFPLRGFLIVLALLAVLSFGGAAALGVDTPDAFEEGMGVTGAEETHMMIRPLNGGNGGIPGPISITYYDHGDLEDIPNDLEEAMEEAEQAILNGPENAAAYYDRGRVKEWQARNGEALKDYSKAIELDPGFIQAYVARGNIKLTRGDYKAAIRDYDRAIALDPGAGNLYYTRGVIKRALGRYGEAIEDFTRANELDPVPFSFYGQDESGQTIAEHEIALTEEMIARETTPTPMAAPAPQATPMPPEKGDPGLAIGAGLVGVVFSALLQGIGL